MGLDTQGNEHQPLANFLWPFFSQDERAALSIHLCDIRSAVLVVVAPRARKAEPVNVKSERGFNVGHMEDGAREPVCLHMYPPMKRGGKSRNERPCLAKYDTGLSAVVTRRLHAKLLSRGQ